MLATRALNANTIALEQVLPLFAPAHSTSRACVELVAGIAGAAVVGGHVLRAALEWLMPLFPHDAMKLYPSLLHREQAASASAPPFDSTSDLEYLLAKAQQYGVPLPTLPSTAIQGDKCLQLLLESPLVESRVQAVRALGSAAAAASGGASEPITNAERLVQLGQVRILCLKSTWNFASTVVTTVSSLCAVEILEYSFIIRLQVAAQDPSAVVRAVARACEAELAAQQVQAAKKQ